ncbi:alkaline shock response membrane anchor protein AmaP [Nucisporomicrobium flavum]|uniref:alkaline shock response membrane anchor protein AmaP n=1 Tax=Nucisporomicrobium flavum TaxID=2785915 RepID=UPI0018F7A5CE|nr:alkaline shock response membrane anchor protein AmaP [Nucisporomicrobium flavum]
MYADRTNRALLTLLGVALLAAGVGGLLTGTGVFGDHLADRHLTDNQAVRYIGDNSIWFWPAVAVAGVVAALLALRWLIAVLSPRPRVGDIAIGADRAAGATVLDADALTDVVTAEITAYRGVDACRAKVYGSPTEPRLSIAVRADADADITALQQRIEDDALTHVREALDRPDLSIVLDLAVGNQASSRVL